MSNYKLTIQYAGTNYSGWQIQSNAPSVQERIIDAIELLLKERVNLIGSGRTDAGVHALGQIANFRTGKVIDEMKFVYSLNAILPEDISVRSISKVDESFHARFDAKSRAYIYQISEFKSPFYKDYTYFYPQISKYDLKVLNDLCSAFLGEHDFTSYSKKNPEIANKICKVKEIGWRKSGELYIFYIRADRFLHGMVRTILGTILYAAERNLGADYINEVFSKSDREAAEMSAPAKGLFLFKVRY